VQLQQHINEFTANGIKVFAISYDSTEVLKKFAERHQITYPLLSDQGSRYIRELGILNTSIPETHHAFGVPYPGVYFIKEDGTIFDKWFHESYAVRDVATALLTDGFGITPQDAGPKVDAKKKAVSVSAQLDSPTYARGQRVGLTVELQIEDGWHIYGKPIPEGFWPTTVEVKAGKGVRVEEVHWPKPVPFEMEGLDEKFFAYSGTVRARTHLVLLTTGDQTIEVVVRFQACNDRTCAPPGEVVLKLPIQFVPHAR